MRFCEWCGEYLATEDPTDSTYVETFCNSEHRHAYLEAELADDIRLAFYGR